jgi:hypothetical protein
MSAEVNHSVSWADFSRGGITTKMRSLDGITLIEVPSARMKSAYTYLDGRTTGQEKGGCAPATGAADINWIICPRTAPMAISKTDQVKIFAPEINQDKDSWKTQYRKYHDIWILENKIPAFQASFAAEPA